MLSFGTKVVVFTTDTGEQQNASEKVELEVHANTPPDGSINQSTSNVQPKCLSLVPRVLISLKWRTVILLLVIDHKELLEGLVNILVIKAMG